MKSCIGYLLAIYLLIPIQKFSWIDNKLVAQEPKKKLIPIPEIPLKRNDPILYEKEIDPIFADKCQSCHSGKIQEGKLDLSSYELLMKGGKRGAAIVAGSAAKSNLYLFASHQKRPIMPPKGEDPLTPQELALVKRWIDLGAKPPTMKIEKPKVILDVPPATVKPIRGLAIQSEKSIVVVGRGNEIFLLDGKTGYLLRTLINPDLRSPSQKPVHAAHLSLVESLAISPDGKTIASGSYDELVLWDLDTGKPKQIIHGFADRVMAIAYSPDGKYMATGGGAPSQDGELKLFDSNGKLIQLIKNSHSDTIFGLAFSPDSKHLASCGADKFVKVWEIPSGKLTKTFEGHTHHVLDVSWQPDGKQLASGGADNVVKIWDYDKGEQIRTINAHAKQITKLSYIAKTNNFLTTGGDNQLKMWNPQGGNMRTYPGSNDFIYALAISNDGKLIIAGGEEGIIRIYNGDNGQLIKAITQPEPEPKKEIPKKELPKKELPKKEMPKKEMPKKELPKKK